MRTLSVTGSLSVKPQLGLASLLFLASGWPFAAAAEQSAPKPAAPASDAAQESPVSLPDVTVTGYRFLDEDTSGITNLPLPIEKVPQSISILNNDFVKAAGLKNMGEIAQYTTGGLWASYSPSYGNQVWLRGFSANYAIDGLTVGDQITEPDPAILERYEIVKGPASVVYGAQSPGGIVNLVSKSASPGAPSYIEARAGSWGDYRLEGQIAGALNKSSTVRGIGVAAQEQADSFVDFVHSKKSVIYGGLDFNVTDNQAGYVRTSYQRTEDTPFNGIPTYANGNLPPVSRSFFLGGSNLNAVAQAMRVNAGLSWQLSGLWSLGLKSIYQYTTHGGGNDYNYSYIAPNGSFPYGGERFNDWNVHDYTIAATTTRKLDDLGLIDSSVSADVRYEHYRYYIDELTGGGPLPNPNINNGDMAVSDIFNAFTPTNTYEQDQRMSYLTASSQAVIKVARPVTLVGGIAYSQPRIEEQLYFGPDQNFNPGDQVNYRGAVMYELAKGLNSYFSYSQSFQPNLRVDTNHGVLPPMKGTQYELGMKYASPANRLLLTAALFTIRENNSPEFAFSDPNGEALYKAESVRHQGLEFEGTGHVSKNWQIRGGVAALDATVTNDPAAPANNGEAQPWLPKVTANLYTIYDVNKRFNIGGGARYIGSVKTSNNATSPTPDIPAYAVFDVAASYSVDRWHLQLNLKNIFDKTYYVSTPIFASLAAGLYPGEPRSFMLLARRDFL